MKSITIAPIYLRQMIDDAQRNYPNECCGFGFGYGHRVLEVVPIRNVASHPSHAYVMDAIDQTKAMFNAFNKGYELVCIYHSHPNSQPVPSETDIRHNHYPSMAHCIIGINSKFVEVGVWKLGERVERLPLLDSNAYEHVEGLSYDPISNIIRFMVLLGVSIFVIAVSIYLLPPPPELPLP
ncbi:MAG: Mov34/MPN/PAD-1 family protein [Phototrophicaceae bacterium]